MNLAAVFFLLIAEQTLPNTGASFRISMSVGTLYALAAGDYVEAQVFQNNGNPLLIRSIAATSPEFGMAKVPEDRVSGVE